MGDFDGSRIARTRAEEALSPAPQSLVQQFLSVHPGEAAREMESAPWMLLFPASFLAVTLYCLNVLGDALRRYNDALAGSLRGAA